MPSPIADALSTGLTSFVDTAQGQFVALLPIALGLVIAIAVTFMAIRYFRGLVKI
jgi:biopolymer transport protein ExbB/TolQ